MVFDFQFDYRAQYGLLSTSFLSRCLCDRFHRCSTLTAQVRHDQLGRDKT